MGYEGQRLELVDVQCTTATAVWRELVVWVWREAPTFSQAERTLALLDRLSSSVTSRPGLWLVTESGCAIPSVSVRRVMASHLRLCRRLQLHAASVEGSGAAATLMRAALRSVAVAAGIRAAHVSSGTEQVALELSEHFPGLSPTWAKHTARVLRAAMARAQAEADFRSDPGLFEGALAGISRPAWLSR